MNTITIKLPKLPRTSGLVVALQKRHGNGRIVMKDRRSKRQNRQSWRKDIDG